MALSKAKSGSAWQSHFWQCGTLQAARDQRFCFSRKLSTQLERTTFWSPKQPMCLRIYSQVPARYKVPFLLHAFGVWRGEGKGSPKTNTHQKTKTKLSSATLNRNKTIHCQRKRNVAAESVPHPRHAAKACDNNTQTIPNNTVLWQRWATCRRSWRH